MKVAFLGLGNMGKAMAQHILKAGHELVAWNRTPAKMEELAKNGAHRVASPSETVKDAEVAITMLADDSAVGTAVLYESGFIDALPENAVHISMSTISIALSRKLAEEHAKRGQRYIAAPVFGRPEAAAAAKLFIVAAGDSSTIEYCKPLLEAMGQRVFVMGSQPEQANVIKLSGNFLIATVIESVGEAVALTRKYGIDPYAYIDFLTNSLFAAPIYKTYGALVAENKHETGAFGLRLGLKDVRLTLAAGEGVNAPLPIASLIRDQMLTALGRGYEHKDWSVLGLLAAENAGLK